MNGKNQSAAWRVESELLPIAGTSGVCIGDPLNAPDVHPSASFSTCSPAVSQHSPLSRRAFTLVELLVTITIIGIIAGMTLAALSWARRYAAEEKTKATIAKLDAIITKRLDSYPTRRIPIPNGKVIYDTALAYYLAHPPNPPTTPKQAAYQAVQWAKLDALRDLMRMELPDCLWDIQNGPQILEKSCPFQIAEPAKHQYYRLHQPWVDTSGNQQSYDPAQCLYLIVSTNPEDLEQFSQNEIGTVGPSGNRVFIDGWGKPIMFLRWAPGYPVKWDPVSSSYIPTGAESVQTRDAQNDHDPFDPRRIDTGAFRLVPLIYSSGPDQKFGLWLGTKNEGTPLPTPNQDGHIIPTASHDASGNPLQHFLGEASPEDPTAQADNFTNHQIEMN